MSESGRMTYRLGHLTPDGTDLLPCEISAMERMAIEQDGMPRLFNDTMTAEDMLEAAEREAERDFRRTALSMAGWGDDDCDTGKESLDANM